VEFYRDLLQKSKGPFLEPAVGNSRELIPLLEAGLAIEGLDAPKDMLNNCELQRRPDQYSQDLSCRFANYLAHFVARYEPTPDARFGQPLELVASKAIPEINSARVLERELKAKKNPQVAVYLLGRP
jgi:hypothetical protein